GEAGSPRRGERETAVRAWKRGLHLGVEWGRDRPGRSWCDRTIATRPGRATATAAQRETRSGTATGPGPVAVPLLFCLTVPAVYGRLVLMSAFFRSLASSS